MTKTYPFYSDSGHGWLRVPMTMVHNLGIARLISSYSYVNGKFAYLEEDLDASIFTDALTASNIKFKFKYHSCDGRSRIRTYDSYKPSKESSTTDYDDLENDIVNRFIKHNYSAYKYYLACKSSLDND